ncbi:hypothetical protein ISS04_02935 [Candidatus Woesearchaeota archaeon]|nr:hypothetical protein [Candidatus Woesearchaeota archaeon]
MEKETDSNNEKEIDIKRVKYFLKHVFGAHKKVDDRNKARDELNNHIEKLKNTPGISKTKRVDGGLDILREKMHNVIKKEKDIISYREIESEKIASLMKEVRILKDELAKVREEKEAPQKSSGPTKKVVVKKSVKQKRKQSSKTLKLLKDQIKKFELVHKKFKKSGKHKKELKIIETKLKSFKDKLKNS